MGIEDEQTGALPLSHSVLQCVFKQFQQLTIFQNNRNRFTL